MPTCEERIYSDDYYDILTDFSIAETAPSGNDYCYLKINDVLGVIYINKNELPPLSLAGYTYRFVPKLYAPMAEENVSFALLKSGILPVQSPPLSLTGQNIIIGIPDSGIDYTNPAFRKADGSTRILAIWDQTIPSSDTSTVPFGTLYTQEEINLALQSEDPYRIIPSKDETGHGTAMASVAGGYVHDTSAIYGGAINAEFVIVKCKQAKGYLRNFYQINDSAIAYSETDLMLGCRFIDSFVRIFNRPVVFCLGVGGNQGAHNGTSLFSEYLNSLSLKRSRVVIVPGGNQGNALGHFSSNGDTDVEIRVGENEKGFSLEIWGNIPERFSIQIVSPGGETTGVFSPQIAQAETYRFIYENTIITASGELTEQGSGLEVMTIIFQAPTSGIWLIRVRDAGDFHMWLPVRSFLSSETYFLNANPDYTITEPGYAQEVITVSGYQDFNNAIWTESGRGNALKPDFSAPAVDIPISANSDVTGTSLSSAITAGAVAQFLEWAIIKNRDPFVKSREIKSYFQRGAVRNTDRTYPNSIWGYGRLNLQGVFDSLVGRYFL
ncbi:MAG: hypothetical protein E7299_06690 [Lachnospiraceae bacterium]|nr:hypothetical protein [Lachnospiraceae bacterium]